ncbi:unnamed protein product [Mycena citricolor]|nr:unnamed protein product [Mycena citricolor]
MKTAVRPLELLQFSLKTSGEDQSPITGCFCGAPYDVKSRVLSNVMHMCPRPRCRRVYHQSCLLERQHYLEMTNPLARLLVSPDCNEPVTLPAFSDRKRRAYLSAAWTDIPEDLVLLASKPMVRGGAALPGLGITGNARDVAYARRTIYAALSDGHKVPERWEESVDLEHSLVSGLPLISRNGTNEMTLVCPCCAAAI